MVINKKNDVLDKFIEWKIPSLKLASFDYEWKKGSFKPFPFLLRKVRHIDNCYFVDCITFLDFGCAKYRSIEIIERNQMDSKFIFPYSHWDVSQTNINDNFNNFLVDTNEILKLLNRGFEWFHVDETGPEWFMNINGNPCWLE